MSDNRVRIWFSVFVLVVFCVGLAGGIVIGRHMGPPPRDLPEFGPMGGAPGGVPPGPHLIDRLSTVLQLSEDQRTKIAAILDARRQKLNQLHEDAITRASTEQREMRAEIRNVLTPDQQKRFDEWLASVPRGRGRGMRGYGR
jgi:Spy/CpxP family protein refolding chaperone